MKLVSGKSLEMWDPSAGHDSRWLANHLSDPIWTHEQGDVLLLCARSCACVDSVAGGDQESINRIGAVVDRRWWMVDG